MDIENQENDQNLSNKLQEGGCEDSVQKEVNNKELSGYNNTKTSKILLNFVTSSSEETDNNKVLNESLQEKLDICEDSNSNDTFLIKKAVRNIIDSDSEEGDVQNKISAISKLSKRLAIIDSDAEDPPTPHNKSFDENLHPTATIYVTDKNRQLIPESNIEDNLKRLTKLCDSESSAEDEIQENENHFDEAKTNIPNKKSNSRRPIENNEKPKKMTTKEAMQQRREIRSESQRMTREMNVSLPYHRPKMRTLKEFLERRPKFASTVPNETIHTPPAVALKMNKEQLAIISKNLSEREKQVEEYFKSESESEDEHGDNTDTKQTDVENNEQVNEGKQLQNEMDVCDTNTMNVDTDKSNRLVQDFNSENIDKSDAVAIDTNETTEVPTETKEKINNEIILENQENEQQPSVVILGNVLVREPNEKVCENNEAAETFILDTDQIIPEESEIQELIEKYDNDEESGHIVPDKKKNFMEIIKEKLGDLKPKLSKTDDFINFDENVTNLMQRFIKHTAKKQPHKHNVHLDIINIANGEVHKEKLEIVIEDDTIPILEKPGERLKKLKDELENKIAKQRSKFWQERIHNTEGNVEKEIAKSKSVDSEDDDILDKVDEDEFTEIEDDEDGDEIIDDEDDDNKGVDDEEMEEKDKKSVFLENEAEESDCDDEDVENIDDEGEKDEEMDVDNADDEKNLDADDEDEQYSTNPKRKKKLRRIIQTFENDSDDEDSNNITGKINALENNNITVLDSTATLDDLSGPTPHQKRRDHTPVKPNMTQTKSELGFLTPVIQLTGLQSLNSGSKFLHESPVSPFVIPKSSPSRMSQSGPQKKLFSDEISDSQTLDDLADLCSGKFISQTQRLESKQNEDEKSNVEKISNNDITKEDNESVTTSEIYDEPPSTTQDFLEICSGKFTGFTQDEPAGNKNIAECEKLVKLNLCEKEIENIKEVEIEKPACKPVNYTKIMISSDEIKNFHDKGDEKLISQLLDEDELEKFKKKFESPEIQVGRKIFDSDDENDISTKKKKVKNCISDEEEEEQEDIEDEIESEIDEDEEQGELQEVEYDSEENEIDVTEQKKKLKASDFFENEAELSESEWGSADEDEKDMDELEFEEGDNEKLDEDKVKRDLERIHMRRILDDDNHEVKMLQEILLDDGELHGTGRERQFKWRNIDGNDTNNDNVPKDDDGESYLDDENETEERWRKMRFEREIFLKKQQETSQQYEEQTIEIESNSQIFKLGQAAIKRSVSNTTNTTNFKSDSPELKTSFTLMNKKGSFLTRSEQVLARVAEFTSKTVNPTIGGAKKSRNFVFHTVQTTTEIEELDLKNTKKRKADEGTPAAIKKLRLNNISPAVKELGKSDRAKKLFSNW